MLRIISEYTATQVFNKIANSTARQQSDNPLVQSIIQEHYDRLQKQLIVDVFDDEVNTLLLDAQEDAQYRLDLLHLASAIQYYSTTKQIPVRSSTTIDSKFILDQQLIQNRIMDSVGNNKRSWFDGRKKVTGKTIFDNEFLLERTSYFIQQYAETMVEMIDREDSKLTNYLKLFRGIFSFIDNARTPDRQELLIEHKEWKLVIDIFLEELKDTLTFSDAEMFGECGGYGNNVAHFFIAFQQNTTTHGKKRKLLHTANNVGSLLVKNIDMLDSKTEQDRIIKQWARLLINTMEKKI